MTTTTISRSLARYRVLDRINVQAIGGAVIRYGLVGVIGWIGLMKFTRVEAEAIWPLVQHSPLMSWASTALGVRPFSNLVGVAEVTIAALIALRPIAARASALGSALAVGMFATTLSFLLTTPGRLQGVVGLLPGNLGAHGTVPAQGRRPAGGRPLVPRRIAGPSPVCR